MKRKCISSRFARKSAAMHEARRDIRKYGYAGAFDRLFAYIFSGAK